MKILYYFPEQSNPMMQWQRVHFIDELSHYNIEFEIFNPLLFDNVDNACQELVSLVKDKKYDLFLTNLCNEHHIHVAAVDEIKRIGIPTMSFRSDNLTMPYNDKDMAAHFDLLWLTSKETQYLYDKWSANTIFAPFAANPYVYKYSPKEFIRKGVFIGTPYGSRAVMINKLSLSGISIDLYFGKGAHEDDKKDENLIVPLFKLYSPGKAKLLYNRMRTRVGRKLLKGSLVNTMHGVEEIQYNECITKSPRVSFDDMIQKYSDYVLSLSFSSTEHTDVLKKPLSRTFLRTFEIPMCGGIQLCRYYPELASYFEDGKEIVLYHDDKELVDKAYFYLNKASNQTIREMKEAARKRSEAEHTWMNRFKIAFDKLGLKY